VLTRLNFGKQFGDIENFVIGEELAWN